MRHLATLCLASLLLCANAAAAPFTLRTVMIDGQSELFSLADSTGAGRWTQIGDEIDGWRVASYDDARKVLTLTRGEQQLELPLANAELLADTDSRPGTLAEADALLQKMRFEEMISETLEAQQAAMAKNLGGLLGKNTSEQERAAYMEFQRKMMAVLFEEMNLPGMRQDLAKIYAETFSQTQLKAISDFYSTPAGQAMIDKQPVMQQHMTELMMPRMMKAMPKIQAMAQTYAQEQAARKAAEPAPAPAVK